MILTPSPNSDLCRINKGESVILKSPKYTKEKKLDYIKDIQGKAVLKFSDINSINEAYKLVGYSVYGSQSPEPDTKMVDIVQFQVKDLQGNSWGIVKDIEISGFNQLLEVESREGNIIFVPYTDAIIKDIDEEKQLILIDPPEGLKDLNT